MLLFFFLLMVDVQEVSLDKLGMYRETHLTLFKTEQGYLLNSTGEGTAVLFDTNGNLLGRFARRGQGPGEFHQQYVLCIDAQGIHFISNGRFMMSFDHAMKPIDRVWPNLPSELNLNANFGLSRQAGTVIIARTGREHLFAEMVVEAGRWLVTEQYLPTGTGNTQNGRQMLLSGKRPLVHGGTVFSSYVAALREDSHYEVEVFPGFLNEDEAGSTLVLRADVASFPNFAGMRALIYSAANTPRGYVVELFTDLRRGGQSHRWHDVYNHRGEFMERVSRNGTRLLPAVNSMEVFLTEDTAQGLILKRIY